jgi:hypothetical protein
VLIAGRITLAPRSVMTPSAHRVIMALLLADHVHTHVVTLDEH